MSFDYSSSAAFQVARLANKKAPPTHCAFDCPEHDPLNKQPAFGEAYLSACGEPTTFELTGPPCRDCMEVERTKQGSCWLCARK